jgi:dTDP-glucose pyrophosphorylase
MVQHVIENLRSIQEEKRFIFILREADCVRHHLDSTIRLLAGEDTVIIKLQRETSGAVCSALLAVDIIATDEPLIIANGDQLFDCDINVHLGRFHQDKIDAGCLCFDSVHPRWSYVRLEGEEVVEAAEKRPLSHHAIAGFYYFAQGLTFVDAAKQMIRKDASVNGQFYVAPVLNELVLENKHLRAYSIPNETYHTFYSPQKIEEYESGRNR